MRLIRFMFKLPAIPLALALWILKWIGIFLVSMSGWMFNAFAGFLFTLGIVLLMFRQMTWEESIPVWCWSMAIFVIPYIAGFITGILGIASSLLREFIMS